MIKKKILITGVAGFIGFSLAEKLLRKNKKVYGIDNLDNYYSVILKKKRLNHLKKYKNFSFKKISFSNEKNINNYFSKIKFDVVIHLGAQAGVRYSLINPNKYIDSNFLGFINIINNSLKNGVKKIIYASSSSVYGDQRKYPFKENFTLLPKNIYGKTKVLNEQIANDISKNNKISLIGLRFFTVYGEWGRPDMFIMKYLNSIFNKKNFYLYNKGHHQRDFTYIDDVTNIVFKLMNKRIINKNLIFNICSSKTIHLKNLLNKIDFLLKKKPKIIKVGFQKTDVLKTHGDNKKIKNYTNYKKFTNFDVGLKKTINWYLKEKIWRISK